MESAKGQPPLSGWPLEARKPPFRQAVRKTVNARDRVERMLGGAGSASPALCLLLQLLHLVANLSSHGACLSHFGEQGCHLVTAQETSGTAS